LAFAQANGYKLRLLFNGNWSECYEKDPSLFRTIAGGVANLSVTVIPAGPNQADPPFHGITDWTWPAGLTIEVTATGPDSTVLPSSSVLPELQIQYYLTWYQVQSDSLWRANGQVPTSDWRFPEYCFRFRLPNELTGYRLRFLVHFNHPEYGAIEMSRELEIKPPCSDRDVVRMRDSYILLATTAHEWGRVLSYADSFSTLGWESHFGLQWAYLAAVRLERYDAALQYMDRCYFKYGTIVSPRMNVPNDTSANRSFYATTRQSVLEKKNQQQQR